jgi:hypothetical protein
METSTTYLPSITQKAQQGWHFSENHPHPTKMEGTSTAGNPSFNLKGTNSVAPFMQPLSLFQSSRNTREIASRKNEGQTVKCINRLRAYNTAERGS